MRRMGGACSTQREVSSVGDTKRQRGGHSSSPSDSAPRRERKLSRHSVVGALPDDSIAHLFPTSDNFVTKKDFTRSPKSLTELASDALCRSLAYLDGELPPGLPQDVVDALVTSLVKHNALNPTTLRILKNCELGNLTLSGCRGVEDDWFDSFTSQSLPSSPASSPQLTATESTDDNGVMESMDLDSYNSKNQEISCSVSQYYDTQNHPAAEESSFSTSSFLSASSTTPHSSPLDSPVQDMEDMNLESQNPSIYYEMFQSSSVTGNMTLLDLRGSQRLTDRGLLKLADLSRLEVARLDNCYSIAGRGLLAFSMSHHLTTLSLANCRRLTDEAIINISHLNSLESLSLNGCRCVTDRAVIALSGLVWLKKLDLSECDLITDDGMEGLEYLNQLEELSLGWCRLISDDGINTLTRHHGRSEWLRILSLARCAITDVGTKHLSRLENLEELNLNGCSDINSTILGQTLGALKKLQVLDVSFCPGILHSSWQGQIDTLKRLDLCYSGVRDTQIARLTHLPNMEELTFDSCFIGDWSLAHLADNGVVTQLTSLDLSDTDVSDDGLVHIAKFRQLKRLSLFSCNISDLELRHLASLDQLEVLNLDCRDIGDDGLKHLRFLKHLKSLDIFSGRITEMGCLHLSRIKSLESLVLCGGFIGGVACSYISTLRNLTSLNLSQNKRITDHGASALAALTRLKTLNLSNTGVTSAVLIHFHELIHLQSLSLYGCRGIDENSERLDELQNKLPALKCVRLNSVGSKEDGMIRRDGNTTEEETDDEDDMEESDSQHYISPSFGQTVEDDDDDDEMDEPH